MKWVRLLLVMILVVVGTASCASEPTVQHEKTDTIHLVPEGFEGQLIVIYNVEGAPKLKKEKGYTLIPYHDDGFYLTSTEDMEYGAVTDEFYYVDQKDKRTQIEQNCTYLFPNSGITITDRRLLYSAYYLTQSHCSEEFYGRGPENTANRNVAANVEEKVREEGLLE
ncbi:DUF6843 domain-containing protein [Guptibacillus hwajinpoensis]|uniref:DUF6843 domain-containing protein n=1 Tax=Guptibacillus hwajinpoensis TaxID=208199 RepID=A0ABU0JZZ3_9BACL|nr:MULTISPECIES: hypothetical protein [Alkalihalobacillus]MDQ0482609.1 hypothetical protein [Alkalihalobacillus hemicentroti]